MRVSVEVHKIIKCATYSLAFFPSGGGVDDVLVRLSLIKQIIKNVNLMCIAFSAKHPQLYIFGIVNVFVEYVQNIFPIYIHTHLTHNW